MDYQELQRIVEELEFFDDPLTADFVPKNPLLLEKCQKQNVFILEKCQK